MRGRIEVITGPMFAGKSTRLLGMYESFPAETSALVAPVTDTRSPDVRTHDGIHAPCKKLLASSEMLTIRASSIFVDEAQFFDSGFASVAASIAKSGKLIVVAGLCLDYLDRPFGPIPDLLLDAEVIHKLYARCARCGEGFATRTRRKDDKVGQVVIGGADRYEPVCRHCG